MSPGPAQHAAVGDDVALHVEQPRARARRLDQAAHHLARQIGQQDLALVGRVEHRALAERGGEDLALGLQRLDLLADQARLVLAEIEKADGEQRQRQDIDREDAPRQRRQPASAVRRLLGRRRGLGPGPARRLSAGRPGGRRCCSATVAAGRRRRGGRLSGRGIDSRRHRGFRSARNPYRRP